MSKPRIEKFDIDGWIAFDKPLGMTSTQAVATIRRIFKAKKGGHAGTLDPLATGVLPIALGEGTKTVPYVLEDGAKSYRFTVSWGQQTSTDDKEGEAIFVSDTRPQEAAVKALLPQFIGKIQQVPPQFSAIKINGERAYDLARQGESVDIATREVDIQELRLVEHDDESSTFETLCGKGTYVRAIARDMGQILGCYGHISALRRTRVGPFLEAGLEELPEVLVNGEMAQRLYRGQSVLLRGAEIPQSAQLWASFQGKLIAICDYVEGRLEPRRVFS
jgi:tRNA pseudouridine55 synthase